MIKEVEIRSLITKERYDQLLDFFGRNGELVKVDDQVTCYFDGDADFRIQQNNFFSKVTSKKGKVHDEHREEIEIKFKKEDFEKLERLFRALGYDIEIKWFRKRHKFSWQGITVCVDDTKGYGYIIELEKMSDDEEKELKNLKEKLKSLKIELTPRQEFEKKFEYYKKNWERLVKE